MKLIQSDFLEHPENLSVIWVNPTVIDSTVGSKWPVGKRRVRKLSRILPAPLVAMIRPAIKRREPFVIPRDVFAAPQPICDTPRYRRVADLLQHRDDVTQSAWYRDLMDELRETGCARHKQIEMRSAAEVMEFFAGYVLPLVDSLEREGFRGDVEGYPSTAVIGPQGEIIKTGSGNHRFCIAKALGLDRFPLKVVGAHEDWASRVLGRAPRIEDVLAALQALAPAAQRR